MRFKEKKFSNNKIIEIERIWEKYEFDISSQIKTLTGVSIDTKNIICYIDSSTTNGYYGDNEIYLGVRGEISKDDILMVITHELFHIFYWKKLKEMGVTKSMLGKETKDEWMISEIAVYLLTNDPLLKKFWPNSNIHIYSELNEMYSNIKDFWEKGDIEFFIINSYNFLKGNGS